MYKKLETSLYYLHVTELKEWCYKLALSTKGKKVELIFRIIHFLKTDEKIDILKYPAISCGKKINSEIITPTSLMLYGRYKNDLKNRLFFKSLIGPHFHFTAFGIDWLTSQWLKGNPPTYNDFATMWDHEYKARKIIPGKPKIEWAFINFMQKYTQMHPQATQKNSLDAWNTERLSHCMIVAKILNKHLSIQSKSFFEQ